MMNFLSLSPKPVQHDSLRWIASEAQRGVRFAVRLPSLGSRIELTRRLQALTRQNEFLANGNDLQQLELALSELLVQRLLIEWGLAGLEGLQIDGQAASVESLIDRGPEALVSEIAAQIRAGCGLTEDERKNS
jgi:hypothetical protein